MGYNFASFGGMSTRKSFWLTAHQTSVKLAKAGGCYVALPVRLITSYASGSERSPMRLLIKLLIVFAACILLMGGCYLRMGGWMMISPKYKESRLLGLTRQEVVDRLGPPSYDPVEEARYTTRPWNEAEDGPQYLGYFQGAGTCVITFKDGKVDAVRKSWK